MLCLYCEERQATTEIETETGHSLVCSPCARDYWDWLREEEACSPSEGYDGPHYVDTMSGGCLYLGG